MRNQPHRQYPSLPELKKPAKMQAFSRESRENNKSLRLSRLFKLFHPDIEKRPQKPADSQAFGDYASFPR
ncbi:hypothetical protein HQN90_14615 [Paenibacillus alba]|nr:hypothetical protein [Paenibacillus alba]